MKLILFNKPFDVMCQFSAHPSRDTLATYLKIPNIYPAGRLDADSDGLVLLTDNGKLQHKISHPDWKENKTYLVMHIAEPEWLWPRNPPIRHRANLPTSWLCIILAEGKNRQVRRMTAAVGLPTLRLIRSTIGEYSLATHPLMPGEWVEIAT
ncbi:MAG: pseudouridine synthase [Burkholderiales bacterium]|nr:pseudouridine synthase [Burkholderiales bacterium]